MTDQEKSFVQQITELKAKADKYDKLAEEREEQTNRIIRHLDTIKENCTAIKEIIHEINPVLLLKETSSKPTRKRSSNSSIKERVSHIYEKIQAGTQVDSAMMIDIFEIPKGSIGEAFRILRKMPNIDERKEKGVVWFFARHDK